MTKPTKTTTSIGKPELVKRLADKLNVTIGQADQLVIAYHDLLTETLAEGTSIQLIGFGQFEVRARSERTGRHPQSGEPMTIPATKVVSFKPGSALKKAVAG